MLPPAINISLYVDSKNIAWLSTTSLNLFSREFIVSQLNIQNEKVSRAKFDEFTSDDWKLFIWSLLSEDKQRQMAYEKRMMPKFFEGIKTVPLYRRFDGRDYDSVVGFVIWCEEFLDARQRNAFAKVLTEMVVE